jgi:hypothetical protein
MFTGPPAFTPVPTPLVLIVAMVVSDELQATDPVMFCVEPSVYVPVAVNGTVLPTATLDETGVIAIETRAAAVTVSEALFDETLPSFAWILTGPPALRPVARPAALIAAMVASDDVHVTEFVIFCV